jgi:hemoglobin-like flavoprotein
MKRIFETSKEIKNMFVFANNLETPEEMIENTKVRNHANQVIKTLNKIVILFTESLISDHDKMELVELGKRHFHYGLKKEHFIIFENCFIKSLDQSLRVSMFQEKFENPWRKLIQYVFKKYTDGMNFEKKEEIKSEKYNF